MADHDVSAELQQRVRDAAESQTPLALKGGGSKEFFGRLASGEIVAVGPHQGVVSYEPTELVITARAGTPLSEIERVLSESGQMLPFEPPHFGSDATLGGTLACGLSGPRRPYAGAARDFVLGTRILNGNGELLRFGGEVMKNVAGYDVSRLMIGALGTLGVLLEASLKVLPLPAEERTLIRQASATEALELMNGWSRRPLPISAACFVDDQLNVRVSGSSAGVQAACRQIGGDSADDGQGFWSGVREHTHPYFSADSPLWRVSVPAHTPPLALHGSWFLDWGGAQRWLFTDQEAGTIRSVVSDAGGHAIQFRGGDRSGDVFHPLPTAMAGLHRNLKSAFDPKGILNPGRMYRDW